MTERKSKTTSKSLPRTLGELKASGYVSTSVKDELRANLRDALKSGRPLVSGVVGYDESVFPRVANAILARQNFILLGLRGQAKTRILRGLVQFLDPLMAALEGSEVNDDPLAPISRFGKMRVAEAGDDAPIAWVPREQRFVEKLATPDVTIADLVGDVDPIKAARGGTVLADELNIHFGLLPRANRGIFVLNELPDLAGKVQVGLFNVMQEGDIQIRGYPVRMSLDVLLAFTANPEDYTARGKIITPLKDRIGSEIATHYPLSIDSGMAISKQEAWTQRGDHIEVPEIIGELVERIAFSARSDKRIDQRSGVSQRMPITTLELAVSNAERRALATGAERIVPRIADVFASLPAITGKLELEYEGEMVGAERIARELIANAALDTFEYRAAGADGASIVNWFDEGNSVQLSDSEPSALLLRSFEHIPGLFDIVDQYGLGGPDMDTRVVGCELVLEALVAERRIGRSESLSYARTRRRSQNPGQGS